MSNTVFAERAADGLVVARVELPRYLGKWHEIATFLQRFQRGCNGSTATYSALGPGKIGVLNECRMNSLDGPYKSINGRARVTDKVTNAKLKVKFFPLIGAPYWIIELDGQPGEQPYEWAVVGSRSARYLWILSRTPQMDRGRLDKILQRLAERGYDVSRLSFTQQPRST